MTEKADRVDVAKPWSFDVAQRESSENSTLETNDEQIGFNTDFADIVIECGTNSSEEYRVITLRRSKQIVADNILAERPRSMDMNISPQGDAGWPRGWLNKNAPQEVLKKCSYGRSKSIRFLRAFVQKHQKLLQLCFLLSVCQHIHNVSARHHIV